MTGATPYKIEPIYVPMGLGELVDVPILHPLRCHREVVLAHCHPQQWQHVWMAKGLPGHNLLTEPLQRSASVGQLMLFDRRGEPTLVTFSKSLVE